MSFKVIKHSNLGKIVLEKKIGIKLSVNSAYFPSSWRPDPDPGEPNQCGSAQIRIWNSAF